MWSAPADDLTDWTYHGVAYETHYDSVLYAPDVVKKGDTYYMYAAEKAGSLIVAVRSKTPWGPFENPVETKLGFAPGVLVEDDGRAYAYWGGCAAPCYIAELEDDMATIKEDTLVENPLGHSTCPWNPVDDGHISLLDGFLSYRFSDSPFGPFNDGGDISFNGGDILEDGDGCGTMTYRWGNNHGSIAQINGKWYVFYHRHTGVNEFSRQAMMEPIDVAMGKDGMLYIGNVKFLNGFQQGMRAISMEAATKHT